MSQSPNPTNQEVEQLTSMDATIEGLKSVVREHGVNEQTQRLMAHVDLVLKAGKFLDQVRNSARLVVDFYTHIPFAEAVTLKPSYHWGRYRDGAPAREFDLEISDMDVTPGRLSEDLNIAEIYGAVRDAVLLAHRRSLSVENEKLIGSFLDVEFKEDAVADIYQVLDVNDSHYRWPVSLVTTRQAVQEAAQNGNIDEVAAMLFPAAWEKLQEELDMPDYSSPAPARPRMKG